MSNFKVLITTSGIGSRLGEYTKFTNKTLVRIGAKPVISHIIDSYTKEAEFVVTLGYFGQQVQDYLEIAHPDRKFDFVTVDKFEGPGSSLLYSILCAKKLLMSPFVFHASDTIVDQQLPEPTFNWNAGYIGAGSSHYASFDIQGDRVQCYYPKGNLRSDFLHIGVIGIKNYQLFWDLAQSIYQKNSDKQGLSDVDVMHEFICCDQVVPYKVNKWYDIGNVQSLNMAKEHISSDGLSVLDKNEESVFKLNGEIIKFFFDETVCSNRIKRTTFLGNTVPKVQAARRNFYKYKYVAGSVFSTIANLSNFRLLLDWAFSALWVPVSPVPDEFRNNTLKFYLDKTSKRLDQYHASRGCSDQEEVVNGIKIPSIANLLRAIDFNYLSNGIASRFHGDFILDNIIYSGENGFTLIDWRQDFGGMIEVGDQYYDLAKLAHNLVVNHEMINKNNFVVETCQNNQVKVDIFRSQMLVECESLLFEYLQERRIDVKKVRLIRAIIWLNMAPLHHHPFDKFLYYFGKYNLFKELNCK
jgi:hypothetical protein